VPHGLGAHGGEATKSFDGRTHARTPVHRTYRMGAGTPLTYVELHHLRATLLAILVVFHGGGGGGGGGRPGRAERRVRCRPRPAASEFIGTLQMTHPSTWQHHGPRSPRPAGTAWPRENNPRAVNTADECTHCTPTVVWTFSVLALPPGSRVLQQPVRVSSWC